jgi:hypothetical protein
MATPTFDSDAILEAIRTWPLADQMALAQAILQRASSQLAQAPQRPTWREMAGLASNGQEPPSDEDVVRWLDEHRMEKYGR